MAMMVTVRNSKAASPSTSTATPHLTTIQDSDTAATKLGVATELPHLAYQKVIGLASQLLGELN